jgi:hypothetical protein
LKSFARTSDRAQSLVQSQASILAEHTHTQTERNFISIDEPNLDIFGKTAKKKDIEIEN